MECHTSSSSLAIRGININSIIPSRLSLMAATVSVEALLVQLLLLIIGHRPPQAIDAANPMIALSCRSALLVAR